MLAVQIVEHLHCALLVGYQAPWYPTRRAQWRCSTIWTASIRPSSLKWNYPTLKAFLNREPRCGIFSWLCGKTDEIVVAKHETDAACRWFHHCLVHEICNIFVPGVIWSKLSTPTDSCSLSAREREKSKKNDTITRLLLYLPTFLVTTTIHFPDNRLWCCAFHKKKFTRKYIPGLRPAVHGDQVNGMALCHLPGPLAPLVSARYIFSGELFLVKSTAS